MSQISLTSRYTPDGFSSAAVDLTWTPSGVPTFKCMKDAILVWVYLSELLDHGSNLGISYEDMYISSVAESVPNAEIPVTLLLIRDTLQKPIEKALMRYTIPERDAWYYTYVTGLSPFYASLEMKAFSPMKVEVASTQITESIKRELQNAQIISDS